jgi:hypothetical protein
MNRRQTVRFLAVQGEAGQICGASFGDVVVVCRQLTNTGPIVRKLIDA